MLLQQSFDPIEKKKKNISERSLGKLNRKSHLLSSPPFSLPLSSQVTNKARQHQAGGIAFSLICVTRMSVHISMPERRQMLKTCPCLAPPFPQLCVCVCSHVHYNPPSFAHLALAPLHRLQTLAIDTCVCVSECARTRVMERNPTAIVSHVTRGCETESKTWLRKKQPRARLHSFIHGSVRALESI